MVLWVYVITTGGGKVGGVSLEYAAAYWDARGWFYSKEYGTFGYIKFQAGLSGYGGAKKALHEMYAAMGKIGNIGDIDMPFIKWRITSIPDMLKLGSMLEGRVVAKADVFNEWYSKLKEYVAKGGTEKAGPNSPLKDVA